MLWDMEEPDCETVEEVPMLVLSVEDAEPDETLAAADVEDAPLMPLLADMEVTAEEDWTARREVAIAKTISL